MEAQALIRIDEIPAIRFVPEDAQGARRSSLTMFVQSMTMIGRTWWDPDVAAFSERRLAAGRKPSTVAKDVSLVQSRYAQLARDNGVREVLYALAAGRCSSLGEMKSVVDEMIIRWRNVAEDPDPRPQVVQRQDRPDGDELRLTREQAGQLVRSPGVGSLRGLRDTGLLGTALATGLREAELVGLDVRDLRQALDGEPALHVREGKGSKERLVPWGAQGWCLVLLEAWLYRAGIDSGAVFRGLHRGGGSVRPGRLSRRAVALIVNRYPVVVDGQLRTVKVHDLRRSFARLCYDAGVDPAAIQQNLGHADLRTTMAYVGPLDVERRRPPALFEFDPAQLALLQVLGDRALSTEAGG